MMQKNPSAVDLHVLEAVETARHTRSILDVPSESKRIALLTDGPVLDIAQRLIEAGLQAKLDIEMGLPDAPAA